MERNSGASVETEIIQNKVLHLKPPRRNVQFTEDTVDNEEMMKKKSNSKE